LARIPIMHIGQSSVIAAVVALIAVGESCSPAKRGSDGIDAGGGGGGDGGGGGGGSACAESKSKAELTPLDIFIMLDQSGSMSDSVPGNTTKWAAVTSAIGTFVGQPSATNMSVGIQYFALPQGGSNACTKVFCKTDADCGASACGPCTGSGSGGICLGTITTGGDSCKASDYATADVAIGALPGVGPAIVTSMSHHSPATGTPTSAALQGAIDYATSWSNSHAGDTVVVAMATDGDPEECDTSLTDIDAIAHTGATATPKILTFVIGVGSDLGNLDGIAVAGGTGSAFLVDTGGNVNQEFLAAMQAIQHTALSCQYAIPQPGSGMLDYQEVNVDYTPGGGSAETIPNVPSAAQCPATGDAWYYDNNNAPTQILLCPSTCAKVTADMSGEVDIALGCSTVVL
jgi:hypothetical protein